MSGLLLAAGLAVLGAAFLSYRHRVARGLGLLCVPAATGAAGFAASGRLWVGALCAAGWFLLPWVEILLRVRRLRLPLRRPLRASAPLSRDEFPELPGLTAEIEEAGFEPVADLGWEVEGYRQFLRLFANRETREEAAITHAAHGRLGFHFVSVTSRDAEGGVFTTWNCPLSPSLKPPPELHLRRAPAQSSFAAVREAHGDFLRGLGRSPGAMEEPRDGGMREAVERDMESQMRHNLREGVLTADGGGHGRYSWRGMVFLWWQCLRDMVRLT